jgi:hypothetical protein
MGMFGAIYNYPARYDPDMSWELEDCFPLNISDFQGLCQQKLETGGYGGLTKHHGDIIGIYNEIQDLIGI